MTKCFLRNKIKNYLRELKKQKIVNKNYLLNAVRINKLITKLGHICLTSERLVLRSNDLIIFTDNGNKRLLIRPPLDYREENH